MHAGGYAGLKLGVLLTRRATCAIVSANKGDNTASNEYSQYPSRLIAPEVSGIVILASDLC